MSATRPDELACIIAQRLLFEPNSHRFFVICEEPAAKAAKKANGVLAGTFGGIALEKGLLKPRK
ncbi:hypothetical protein AAE026_23940 [Bradyrhizobium sp. DN5]|uniref:hypothetical protein n=1 Tax=unclassified Bradyrhizobium TaxID=2631580 RepID=UPI0010296EAC|nr:hypothetical protein [Bradyrhizobium genosp. SA-3]